MQSRTRAKVVAVDGAQLVWRIIVYVSAAMLAIVTLTGCTKAQQGALIGAAAGAAIGQAAGRDTESTLIGTGIGTAAGYMIGNEMDKAENE